MNDLDDLLGPSTPVAPNTVLRRGPGRPRKDLSGVPLDKVAAAVKSDAEPTDPAIPHPTMFRRPVGITFLADVLGKQPVQIAKRLDRCPIRDWNEKGQKRYPLYDFMEAMSYLIEPKGNIEDWMASKNAASLPPYINKMFWDSAMQRIKVMRLGNELWHSDEVLIVFGRVAMLIKEETKMWVEDLPEKDILTNEQYNALKAATARLNDQIRERLVDLPGQQQTLGSMSRTIDSELTDASRTAPDAASDG